MLQDMLPPLFQIFTGLTFMGVLLIGTRARAALKPLHGRLAAMALLPLAVASLILSYATARPTLGAASELFVAAGISLMVSAALLVLSSFLSAKSSAG